MLAMRTPCEPPIHSAWHVLSGMAVLTLAWTALVVAARWWGF